MTLLHVTLAVLVVLALLEVLAALLRLLPEVAVRRLRPLLILEEEEEEDNGAVEKDRGAAPLPLMLLPAEVSSRPLSPS